jgi:hypothetical protein
MLRVHNIGEPRPKKVSPKHWGASGMDFMGFNEVYKFNGFIFEFKWDF